MVQLELAKWLTREVGEDKADRVIAFTETCVVADLDTDTALSAAELCAKHKLSTADAIVYATAKLHGADLLTCDRHFENLPNGSFSRQADDRMSSNSNRIPERGRLIRMLPFG